MGRDQVESADYVVFPPLPRALTIAGIGGIPIALDGLVQTSVPTTRVAISSGTMIIS